MKIFNFIIEFNVSLQKIISRAYYYFYLNEVKIMFRKLIIIIITLLSSIYTLYAQNDPVYDHIVWSDEFNVNGALDSTKWFHQTKLPAGGSWYNGEIQHYTDRTENTYVYNGYMFLVAQKEIFTDQGQTKQYTSARLNSKYAFRYGRVEVYAKLPSGVGTWPAIWMLGKNITEAGAYWEELGYGNTPWPACGEIDIMEHWGTNQNFVQSATHTPSSYGGTVNHGGQVISTASTNYHLYALDWSPEKLVFSVDSVIHYTYEPLVRDTNTWPFDAEMYLLLNIAIQSDIDPAFTKSSMIVNYIRIYDESPVAIAQTPTSIKPSIYPNPVNDRLNISMGTYSARNVTVRIYGLDGKLVKTYTQRPNYDMMTLNGLKDLTNGVYIVAYDLLNKHYSFKVIKH